MAHAAIVIPARLGSQRLPRKPLAPLGGKPLVARTYAQAKKCQRAHEVVVATDAVEIADALAALNIPVRMTRAEHQSGSDRVAEVAEALSAEIVVNVQGDEPFLHPGDLDALITALQERDVEIATLWAPIDSLAQLEDPAVVKVVLRDDGEAMYFSRSPIPFGRNSPGDLRACRRHVGVYAYRRPALFAFCALPAHPIEQREGLEQLRALAAGMRILAVPAQTRARGIDTPEDLRWAENEVRRLGEAAFPS